MSVCLSVSSSSHSLAAMAVVGALLAAVVASLVVFVLLRRRRIKRKRTLRRILQEREVGGRVGGANQRVSGYMLNVISLSFLGKMNDV